MAATELRVHLGAVLKALEHEDVIIEKGGVPVALLVRYEPEGSMASYRYSRGFSGANSRSYSMSLSRSATPGGIARMDAAMAAGWAGINAAELTANVYRWREEGATARGFSFDDERDDGASEGPDDGGEVSSGQRYVYQQHPETSQRVAEKDGPGYTT